MLVNSENAKESQMIYNINLIWKPEEDILEL